MTKTTRNKDSSRYTVHRFLPFNMRTKSSNIMLLVAIFLACLCSNMVKPSTKEENSDMLEKDAKVHRTMHIDNGHNDKIQHHTSCYNATMPVNMHRISMDFSTEVVHNGKKPA